MSTALHVIYWLAGLLVLAEALNKLERTAPCRQVLVQADRRRLAQRGADGLDGDRLTVALQTGGRCRATRIHPRYQRTIA